MVAWGRQIRDVRSGNDYSWQFGIYFPQKAKHLARKVDDSQAAEPFAELLNLPHIFRRGFMHA